MHSRAAHLQLLLIEALKLQDQSFSMNVVEWIQLVLVLQSAD